MLAARLDRLPPSRHLWRMILVLSAGGIFEFYDLFVTAYVAPGMVKSGLFTPASLGPFALLSAVGSNGVGTFVFVTFAGLFAGATLLGWVADRYGRRLVFTASLLWYSAATILMALQGTGLGIDAWRFVAGIGLGVELVTIDTYVAELVPRSERGRAFAVNQVVAFLAVPLVALLAWQLVPQAPFGIDGWRIVVMIGGLGALLVWFIRRRLPESARWLARRGRLAEATAIVATIEAKVASETGRPLPPPGAPFVERAGMGRFSDIWQPPFGGRTLMLSVFNLCQTIGFYGFAAWVPSLLVAKGIQVTTSLMYAFVIAIANPVGPLLGILVPDRMERKWQIVAAALAVGLFGLAFARQSEALPLILLGVLITLANNWMSFAFHNYQAELFPTRIRARAIGFVYAWSRLSAAFAGLLIGALLQGAGVAAVFVLIAGAMLVVILSIGLFGPRTRGLALEDIAP